VQATVVPVAKFKAYVSKDKQLERLRLRLQREGPSTHFYLGDVCLKCDSAMVFL
jgi:hypothetical protein